MNMKRFLCLLLISTLVLSCVSYAFAEATMPEISAPSAVLMEASTGRILYEKNSHEKLPPASVTKVMTMLLVMEAIDKGQLSMQDTVRCSEVAASMGGSQVYLEPGEEMSVHDMLKAVAVASGNDAAAALGEHLAGSLDAFVDRMNERAKELGMQDTHFVNCNGLDAEGHLTSSHDIALMSRELISHSGIYEFTKIWMDSLRGGAFGLVNTNKLIRFYEGATGLKTGSTGAAKYCLSATANRNGMDLIAVIMGAETSQKRFNDAKSLLDFGFANYTLAKSLVSEEELGSMAVVKGKKSCVDLSVGGDYQMLVSKPRAADIEKKLTVSECVEAPVLKGEKLGEISFVLDGEEIGKADIVAKEDVLRMNPAEMLRKLAFQLFYGDSEA